MITVGSGIVTTAPQALGFDTFTLLSIFLPFRVVVNFGTGGRGLRVKSNFWTLTTAWTIYAVINSIAMTLLKDDLCMLDWCVGVM